MFGIKVKEKPAKEKTTVPDVQSDDKVEENKVEQVKDAPVEQENVVANTVTETVKEQTDEQALPVSTEQKKDGFDLAYLLGKTESGLKSEFYAYQIKELMKSIGVTLKREDVTSEQLENVYKQVVKYGADEIAVSPYFYQACKDLESKFKNQAVKFGAMIDYPYGESSFKARLADVKVAVQNGVNLITVVFPTSATALGGFGGEKLKLNKLCKVGKRSVGVAIKADQRQEDLKRLVKLIDGTKCSHITLLAEGVSVEKIADAIKVVSAQKSGKKVFVLTTIENMQDLSAILELKVDKVYTPYIEKIGEGLTEKFGIKM